MYITEIDNNSIKNLVIRFGDSREDFLTYIGMNNIFT